MKVAICTMEKFDNRVKDSVGSSRIRGRWLLNYWEGAEEYQIGQKYDCIIFQKVYWENMVEQFPGIKILDICDPDWLEGKPVFRYIDMMDAVVTSSEALRDYILKLRPGKKVVCIPDRIYLPEFPNPKTVHEGIASQAVWYGYTNNVHYLTQTFDALLRKNIALTVVADSPYEPPLSYQALKVQNVPYSYPAVNQEIVKHDFVLLPDVSKSDERGKYKSTNKQLNAWALGMPVVKTESDLERFMSATERKKESDARLQEVKEKWDVKLSVTEYKQLLSELATF